MKVRVHRLVIVVGALMFCGFAADKIKTRFVYGNSLTGKVHATQKPDRFFEGCFCHSPDGIVQGPHNQTTTWISGPSALREGESAVFALYGRKDSLIAGGFNIAAFFGTLDTLSEGMRKEDGELTHRFPKIAQGDTLIWQFRYAAPSASVATRDTIYASFCAVDTSYDPNGDYWNYAPKFIVTILPNVSAPQRAEKPTEFSLSQNYPNPFNPTTTIAYRLPVASDVTLELFDALGRKITTLLNARQDAGEHRYALDASRLNLSSGVYLYRLRAGRFVETKKMLLLK
ncbi:MAG: T9SS type A sorting domain-containing protein [Chloroherpetonaceae bacterium]|nr:T9SS type A sorting domain-containing protein [Chloroherpetonaceae bacterium]MDW8437298.1 T9SS type A sorting domain-containing protein [Chloroherpetonaceae bacterium]